MSESQKNANASGAADFHGEWNSLPVASVLPELRRVLRDFPAAVLASPPGSGKTTLVPPGLLGEFGKIIMLEPRRLAAKAAAGRIARILGSAPGGLAGYRVRGESKVSSATRIEVVTEGILTRMLQDDPELHGVGLVIFDEFHERHLEGDLGLALVMDTVSGLRPDLRILVMSATLDCDRVSRLLGDAPVVRCEGTLFPVRVHWGEGFGDVRSAGKRAASLVRRVLREREGDILVFLPGAAEIGEAAELLRDLNTETLHVEVLHGSMDFRKQNSVIAPSSAGCRKVVLATNIAESSLTIEGIRAVIDSGLERISKFDPATGMERLVTVRASSGSMRQRAGRAGRVAEGDVYRFCTANEFAASPPDRVPEILSSDLSGMVLEIACWGAKAGDLRFLDPPPEAAWKEGESLLRKLGLLTPEGLPTARGRAVNACPAHPRLGTMMTEACRMNLAPLASELAALASERDIGGSGSDLFARLDAWRKHPGAFPALNVARDALLLAVHCRFMRQDDHEAGRLLAFAYPDRIGRRRGRGFLLACGRGAFCEAEDETSLQEWIVAVRLSGAGANERILLALPYSEAFLRKDFSVEEHHAVRLEEGRVAAFREEKFGAIVLRSVRLNTATPEDAAELLAGEIARHGENILNMDKNAAAFLSRLRFARKLEGAGWKDPAEHWREILLFAGCRSVEELRRTDWAKVFRNFLGFEKVRKLDAEYPEVFATPAGTRLRIDYSGEKPVLAVRVQELYGLQVHPVLGSGRQALVLSLLSPAGRPVQITGDLPGFWAGSWKEVRKEMRSRYPKHFWPEDPARAEAATRVKRRES